MDDQLEDHIIKRFMIHSKKGAGAYGVVFRAVDRMTGKQVAIKKCFDIFLDKEDAEKTYREIAILKKIKHKNIVKLLDVIKSKNLKDIYLIFEYVNSDLYKVSKLKILNKYHYQFITYQILLCLKFLHSGGIIHRDLKPANILIDSDCNVKVADFGQARTLATSSGKTDMKILSGYIATRWYRAPEIVFEENFYGYGIDVWSVGCILAELILGEPLFPGTGTLDQIKLICDLLGKPKPEETRMMFTETQREILKTMRLKKRKSFRKIFKGCSKIVINFLKKTLCFNPLKRMTVEEALKHPFFLKFRNKKEEVSMEKKLEVMDTQSLDIEDIRKLVYQEIDQSKYDNKMKMKERIMKLLGYKRNVDIDKINFVKVLEHLKKNSQLKLRLQDIYKEKMYGTFPRNRSKGRKFFG